MSFRNQLVADSNYLRSMFETNFRVCMETDRRIRISATLQRIVYVVFAAFLALFIIYLAVSCSQKGDVRANTVITDYLYGVEYDDYDFDLCIKEYDKRGNEMWADEWFRNQVSDKKKEWDDKSLWHIPSTPLWYTTHTCVYDLAKKELSIKVHEGFDGMDKFHTVSFDTHFNKPYDVKY